MELETLKQDIFRWAGWISLVIGLFVLAMINISLISGYSMPLANQFSLLVFLSVVLSIIVLFPKHSRSLGIWGLLICLYIGFFATAVFFLGWMINPFP